MDEKPLMNIENGRLVSAYSVVDPALKEFYPKSHASEPTYLPLQIQRSFHPLPKTMAKNLSQYARENFRHRTVHLFNNKHTSPEY